MKTFENIQNTLLNTDNLVTSIELKNERKVYFNFQYLMIEKTFYNHIERTIFYNDKKKYWAAVKRYVKQQ